MIKNKSPKPIGHTIWFKTIITIVMFLPSISQVPYDSKDTSEVIALVLANPFISQIDILLPILKLLLLIVAILPFILRNPTQKLLLYYYGIALLVVSVFQNLANTGEYGYVWLMGNTLVQMIVMLFCFYDLIKKKTVIKKEYLNKNRLWVLVPMLLAYLMPYSVNVSNIITPSFTAEMFFNEAGVTYCMITPVIIGVMIIFSKGIFKPLLSVISYVGFVFGILNMMTWFIMQSQNWWMGILHLPLLIISFYGLVISNKEKN